MTDTATLPATTTPATTPATPGASAASDSQVLSILSLISALSGILFGLVLPLSIVAIVLGILALSREPRGRTMAIWGIVVGAVPGALAVLAIVFAAAFLIPFGVFAAAFGGF